MRIRDAVTTVWEAASTHGSRTSSVEMADDARSKRESYELELVEEAVSSQVDNRAAQARLSRGTPSAGLARQNRPNSSTYESGVS